MSFVNPRIGYAVDVVKDRNLPKAPKNLKLSEIADVQMFLSGQKAHRLTFTEDPTGGLLPGPALLTE